MTRPVFLEIVPGQQGWDAEHNNNVDILLNKPWPPFHYEGDETELEGDWPAADYPACFLTLEHSTDGELIAFSNGTVWKRVSTAAL